MAVILLEPNIAHLEQRVLGSNFRLASYLDLNMKSRVFISF